MSVLPEKCPVCGELMEKGYIGSVAAPMKWGKEKPNWAGFWTKSENLLISKGGLGNAIAEAYRCRNCEIIIFSYQKKSESKLWDLNITT